MAQRTGSDLDDKLAPMARRIVPIVIYAVGALMALDVVGITIAPMIAGLGIAGIAVGLALQPTLGNLFSGMFMVSEGELNEGTSSSWKEGLRGSWWTSPGAARR